MPQGAIQPYKGRDAEALIAQALELYEEHGKEISEAAQLLDVPQRSLYRWIATNAPDRWRDAQQARAMSEYEIARTRRQEAAQALRSLEGDSNPEAWDANLGRERNWQLSHAREVLAAADNELDHQKWLLERLLSKLYGAKPDLQVNIGGSLIAILGSIAPQQSGPEFSSEPSVIASEAQVVD